MADAGTLASVNGDPTVLLQIRKQSGTNTVAIVNGVKERLAEIEPTLPPGYQLRIVRDQAEFIEASIESVAGAPRRRLDARGAGRAAVPRQPPLHDHRRDRDPDVDHRHVRPHLVHGLHAQHADDAGADARRSASSSTTRSSCWRTSTGSSKRRAWRRREAAVEATKEIGLAVLATTLSLVAIFVPVAFMGGIVGRFMQSFGLTMAFAIMVSLLVSFTLTPMMSRALAEAEAHTRERRRRARLEAFDDLRTDRSRLRAHARLVDGASRHRRRRSRCSCCSRASRSSCW